MVKVKNSGGQVSVEDGEFAITSRFCICCCTAVKVLPPIPVKENESLAVQPPPSLAKKSKELTGRSVPEL